MGRYDIPQLCNAWSFNSMAKQHVAWIFGISTLLVLSRAVNGRATWCIKEEG